MDIVESNAQIEKIINDELQTHFRNCWIRVQPAITNRIRYLLINAIKTQPEYDSLLRGRLYSEFGLTDPRAKLNAILDVWSKNFETRYLKKVFKIEAIDADFANVLNIPEAMQATSKGQSLAWLDWLLIQGDTAIVREYEITTLTGAYNNSRTGTAIMKKTKTGSWRVPSQYAGNLQSNWVTRAIDDIDDGDIEDAVFSEIEKVW